jgi:hypothetical protein
MARSLSHFCAFLLSVPISTTFHPSPFTDLMIPESLVIRCSHVFPFPGSLVGPSLLLFLSLFSQFTSFLPLQDAIPSLVLI